MHEKKHTILVVDDEPHIQKMLSILLAAENFKVINSTSGMQALRLAMSTKPDLVLLDLGLPDMDGKDLIATLREWSQVPVIVLSARSSDEEVVKSLNIGANDFVSKPFSINVLLARINAALRVSAVRETGSHELANGPLRMDLVRHEVFLNKRLLSLTPKEYDLLKFFMVNRGKMLSHKEILKEVWGAAHGNDTPYLRVYIKQLRKKIEQNSASPRIIVTEPGIGYRMEIIRSGLALAA
jgi:two-component system, OmpR family, KDP operon response regulator KdpE